MFQKKALAAVERGHSVLVAAHTSAGKTVVAQYAVAMSLARKQRVVYTSPIKALSNQKFRELSQQFGGDVGLMTGDVNVNPDASVLVMTTEILRNMLYRGHELVREVQWVIFDEVHYMRDKERGVIWEECIILLPSAARFVFLSATIPNAGEFAHWVAATHKLPVHVISTSKRPTPLEHWVLPAGGDGLLLIKGGDGVFNTTNFEAAMQQLRTPAGGAAAAKSDSRDSPDLKKVIRMLQLRQLTPAVIFSFSRRACEGAAMHARGLEPLSDAKQTTIRAVFDAAVATLGEADQQVEQIERLLPLLLRGVAVHHSGLLPVLKEVVEILFQEGLVLLLFATETFALGLNMPARAVVFTSIRKWDGETFRPPTAAEYIQMSGRAGRRGIDSRGMVILLLPEELEQQTLETMMAGSALPLESAFRLRYNTLLKLYALESYDPEQLVRKSFYTFQRQQRVPELARRRSAVQIEAQGLSQPNEPQLRELLQLRSAIAAQIRALSRYVHQPRFVLHFLQPGRVLLVGGLEGEAADERGWGVLLGWRHERYATDGTAPGAACVAGGEPLRMADMTTDDVVLDVLLPCKPGADALASEGLAPEPSSLREDGAEPCVLALRLSCMQQLSAVRLWLPDDMGSKKARHAVLCALRQMFSPGRLGDSSIARHLILRPVEHLGVTDLDCLVMARQLEQLESEDVSILSALAESRDPVRSASGVTSVRVQLDRLECKMQLELEDARLAEEATSVACDEFAVTVRKMHRVLVRLGHVDDERVVQLKGRAAAEIDASDEILVAELMFSGFFNDLSPAAIAALCSCLIAADMETVKIPPATHVDLQAPLAALHVVATQVARVLTEAGIPTDEVEYKGRFDGGMVNMVYSWCHGVKFFELCKTCELFEGSIIRALRRLSELLDELKSAAKAIGNDELFEKLDVACTLIRRDIVFASSLYIEM
jgi:ATP-dependent RNA helicase DOB1